LVEVFVDLMDEDIEVLELHLEEFVDLRNA
jgi:hypothetical protein